MVVGVGTDLVDLDRFRQAAERTPGILTRYFTDGEQAYAERRRDPTERYAARFAAKEAVMKALGTGARSVGWREIEVLPDRRGQPLVYLYGGAAARAETIGLEAIDISLSHLEAFAVAVVVCAQQRPEQDHAEARQRIVGWLRSSGRLS